MLPHPLTNFEIQKYYQTEPRFNDVFPRNNLSKKINDGIYVMMQAHIELLYFVTEMKLLISIVFVLNMFVKKLKNLLEIKAQKQIFFEYK